MSPYAVRLAPGAARAFKRLPAEVRGQIRAVLTALAIDVAEPGRVGGKRTKTIRGAGDSFHRLRVGDHRIMYDVIDEDRVILVLGIVDRAHLERWIRNR